MSRVRPALAVLLLVAASAAGSLGASGVATAPVEPGDAPVVGVSENSTRVLLVTDAAAAEFASSRVSVTSALDTGTASLDASYQLERVRQRLAATDNETEREAIVRNATDWAGERVTELRAREASAREAFTDGRISAESYLLTLGSVHEKASTLRVFLRNPDPQGEEGLYSYADDFIDLQTDVSRDRAKLEILRGPVRERLAAVTSGERDTIRVHVTAGNGVMLSTIDGGDYVRETVRPDNADDALGGSIGAASAAVEANYPWMNEVGRASSVDISGNYAYVHTDRADHAELETYIDTTTERVFAERQWKELLETPVTYEYTTASNNTTLLVSRTYAGGPVNVRVENETGEPLDATVTLNGTEIGSTGIDGELWALSPAGDYPITVTHDGVELDVSVTARPAP